MNSSEVIALAADLLDMKRQRDEAITRELAAVHALTKVIERIAMWVEGKPAFTHMHKLSLGIRRGDWRGP